MDAFASYFTGGSIPFPYGQHVDDFYYTLNKIGKKIYYSRRSGKKVSLNQIPAQIQCKIKERSKGLDNIKLLRKEKALVLERVTKLNKRIATIDEELRREERSFDYEASMKEDEAKQRAAKDREKEEERKFFEMLFGRPPLPPKKRKAVDDSVVPEEFLKSQGITSKNEWKQWLLKNHPDKGGKDEILCQQVVDYGREMNW
jgi:hypothetical protein